MKRFAALALVLVGFGIPAAFGQRGGGHGGGFGGGHGFSGGSVGAFHGGGFAAPHFSGGFSAPRFSSAYSAPRFSNGFAAPHYSRGFAPSRSYEPRGSANYRLRYSGSYPINPRSGSGYSSGYGHSGSYHHHGGGGFNWSITTVPNVATLVPGWVGLGPYGYYPGYPDYFGGDGWDDDPPASSDQSANAGPQGYEQAPEQQEQPVYRQDYDPPAPMPAPIADPAPENQRVTTIVFNDGRPQEQIRNYALTATTLYVLDAQR